MNNQINTQANTRASIFMLAALVLLMVPFKSETMAPQKTFKFKVGAAGVFSLCVYLQLCKNTDNKHKFETEQDWFKKHDLKIFGLQQLAVNFLLYR